MTADTGRAFCAEAPTSSNFKPGLCGRALFLSRARDPRRDKSRHELQVLVLADDHGATDDDGAQRRYENLAEARVFAKGFARRQPDNETVLIESEDGYVRERWIWLNGVWERDDLL